MCALPLPRTHYPSARSPLLRTFTLPSHRHAPCPPCPPSLPPSLLPPSPTQSLHAEMERDGYKCTSITGDMQPTDRDRVVQEFRDGTTKILISTDVLSRGFDVSQVGRM